MIGRSHLRVVSDRYDGTVVDGKSSISVLDAEIIDLLIDYHIDLEQFEIAGLLSKWKVERDSKFIDRVRAFTKNEGIEHSVELDKESKEEEAAVFITFAGSIFRVSLISLIRVDYGWSVTRLCNVFYIEINSREQYPNRGKSVRLEYKKEEARDKELEILKQKLISYGVKFI